MPSSNRIFLGKNLRSSGKSAYTAHMYAHLHACKLFNMQLDEIVTLPHQIWEKCFCKLCCCVALLAVQFSIINSTQKGLTNRAKQPGKCHVGHLDSSMSE